MGINLGRGNYTDDNSRRLQQLSKVAEDSCLHHSGDVVEGKSGEYEVESPGLKSIEIVVRDEEVLARRICGLRDAQHVLRNINSDHMESMAPEETCRPARTTTEIQRLLARHMF